MSIIDDEYYLLLRIPQNDFTSFTVYFFYLFIFFQSLFSFVRNRDKIVRNLKLLDNNKFLTGWQMILL